MLSSSPPRKNSPHKSKPNRPTTPPPSTPPTSPSKTKLISPSKKGRIPPTPHRPSNEAFWNQAFTNDWNDEYSPRKKPESPKKQKFGKSGPGSGPDSEETSMEPKAMQKSPTKRDRKAIEARKQFEIQKHALADTFLKELDDKITGGKVAEMTKEKGGVRIVWSKKLNSTAGRAHWRKEGKKTKGVDGTIVAQYWHDAWIELAEKVIDDEERLINVIAHEFCHLANYIVSGIKDKPHGQQFKAWGKKVGAAFGGRGVEVTTTHSYKIDYKYIWACSKCGHEYKRHSKSIDPKRHCCAKCKSLLIQTKPVARSAGPSEYQLFVKAHFQRVKKENGGASHGAVMEILGRMYRESKAGKTEPVSSVDGAEDIIDEVVKAVEVITLKD
ncbi:SprT-like family-domain-containing protein [Lineolata rhizophorae]|uniref:SprT-like family-domain-containing protein n=1 Tax=Lineolata rhizophorae TaxID=578093 RepID=A0A6A6P6K3_9PEZI|nr:SprT-like family-domain-containing protein [Lineolata rhizophorae]